MWGLPKNRLDRPNRASHHWEEIEDRWVSKCGLRSYKGPEINPEKKCKTCLKILEVEGERD